MIKISHSHTDGTDVMASGSLKEGCVFKPALFCFGSHVSLELHANQCSPTAIKVNLDTCIIFAVVTAIYYYYYYYYY